MAQPQRLPAVNGDDGAWGDILNQYISKEHYNTGADNAANGGHKTVTLQAGTVAVSTAPLKFTSGPLLSAPEAGAVEFLTDAYYGTITTGTARKQFAFTADVLKLDQTTPQTIINGQPIFDTLTASQIVATDANKKLQTLAVATYPSLTELSYVKGLSSAVQTQLSGKETSSNKVTTWSAPTTNTNYPSEKLVKDSLDTVKAASINNTYDNSALTMWNGTLTQYNAIVTKSSTTIYIITN